jgi:hypothetical protein
MTEDSKYLSILFMLCPFVAQAQFVHPGLLDCRAEL